MVFIKKVNLVELIKSFNDKIYFFPNPGNAGDSLIACATFQFFERNKINYELVLDTNFDAMDKTVVYGGGGNFGGVNSRVGKFLTKNKDKARNIIILPHTIYGAEKLLPKLRENIHIICREHVSFMHTCNFAQEAKIYLHDDMVFLCDIRELMKKCPKTIYSNHLFRKFKNIIMRRKDDDFGLGLKGFITTHWFFLSKKIKFGKGEEKILNAFRRDSEKTAVPIPKGNLDLSSILELSACHPELAKISCYNLLNEIDKYDEIRTNRLHIAIAAMLLGKKVNIYANNYFKIRAIYEFSIKDKFLNVEWIY